MIEEGNYAHGENIFKNMFDWLKYEAIWNGLKIKNVNKAENLHEMRKPGIQQQYLQILGLSWF